MINYLRFKNFKCWQDTQDIIVNRITGFFGANSSGKTSILQFLLMLKQTVESPDLSQVLKLGGEQAYIDLGTWRELKYRGGTSAPSDPLSWSLVWMLPTPLTVEDPTTKNRPLFSTNQLDFHASIKDVGGKEFPRPIVDEFMYSFTARGESKQAAMTRKDDAGDEYALTNRGFDFKRIQGRPWPLPAPIKCYGFPPQVGGYYENAGFVPAFALAFEEVFSRIYYLGPLREYPKRHYVWGGGKPSDMGQRGELTVEALLASRERGEKIARGRGRKAFTVEEYVAFWLKELGLIHSFSVEPLARGSNVYQVLVQARADTAPLLLTDVGFGVSQVLPVLALCYYVPEGSTIILEQPEIHLHPLVQAGLADVFIDAIKTRDIQIILESHSEHLLVRLQRRIAEERIGQQDVSLYFCERDDAAARLTPMEVDPFGNIKNWPKNFFGDEMGERTAMMKAAIHRRQQAA